MYGELSVDTQVVLLLTAPLLAGKSAPAAPTLSPSEYRSLLRFLRDRQLQPSNLLDKAIAPELTGIDRIIKHERIQELLGRGLLLSQAVERWRSHAIWVLDHTDARYPRRLLERLRDDAPPTIYGCGDVATLASGGLAIVGSRHADEAMLAYGHDAAQLAVRAGLCVISGAARGVDQTAMRGAIQAGGTAIGIMADSLERASINRENRDFILARRLVLASPYDPAAGFNVGNAMKRNRLIYALADAALVVSSAFQSGGTWAGAVEQLEKLRFVPVYIRSNGPPSKGLDALRRKGALPWPNLKTTEDLNRLLADDGSARDMRQFELPLPMAREPTVEYSTHRAQTHVRDSAWVASPLRDSASLLFATVRSLLRGMMTPATESEVAAALEVSTPQARDWLKRLVSEGVLEELSDPVRYRATNDDVEQPAATEGVNNGAQGNQTKN